MVVNILKKYDDSDDDIDDNDDNVINIYFFMINATTSIILAIVDVDHLINYQQIISDVIYNSIKARYINIYPSMVYFYYKNNDRYAIFNINTYTIPTVPQYIDLIKNIDINSVTVVEVTPKDVYITTVNCRFLRSYIDDIIEIINIYKTLVSTGIFEFYYETHQNMHKCGY